jgi:hypothetical protein
MPRLTEIPHDSDKGGYLPIYERHFAPLADEPIRLLELGVYRGASLRLWRDYFSRGLIVGLDEQPVTVDDPSGRIAIYQGRQQDTALLDRIARERAPHGFDIIIDDCAHLAAPARASFWFLLERHLKPGGLYAIEDWGTGYWPDWPDGQALSPNHAHGMVGFIKDLVDECGAADATHPDHVTLPPRRSRLASLEIHPGLAIAIKARR